MSVNPSRFAELLTRAVNRIHADEGKKKTIVRDELGYAAGREGRTAIDYWCRDEGHVPAKSSSVEGLAREIARRGGLSEAEMEAFLASADYSESKRLCRELYPADQVNDVASVAAQPEMAPSALTQPIPGDNTVAESEREIAGIEPAPQAAMPSTVGTAPMFVHTRARGLLFRVRWLLFLLGLVALALTAAVVLPRLPAQNRPLARGQLQLVQASAARIQVESAGRSLVSGDSVPVHTPITVTFQVMNNGVDPIRLRALTIGVRGPGVTCRDSNAQRWSALDAPFPAITGLILSPGQMYEYQGSRALYLPGAYFLEPVEQDASGHWGGIPPFTCVDLTVIENKP